MKPILFKSECSPAMNAKILRAIEKLVCHYRNELQSGWRCCIELQRSEASEPYYQLDLQSNQGGGDFAPVKMRTLRLCPDQCATGIIDDPSVIVRSLLESEQKLPGEFCERLTRLHHVSQLTAADWDILRDLGITHWYGGIRIPYKILVTKIQNPEAPEWIHEQGITETSGELRIAFSGAKEWQDTYFAFCLFEKIQSILNNDWSQDQIWWNLRDFDCYPNLSFWVKALDLREAPED